MRAGQSHAKTKVRVRCAVRRSVLVTNRDGAVYALPGNRYPITNTADALDAVAKVDVYGTPADRAAVRAAVSARFPDLAVNAADPADPADDDANGAEPTDNVEGAFQSITFNAGGAAIRHEILEGRQYTVVPMVMLTEGVHAGSQGPLYYPKEELAKTPAVWNHKPIVVYHPTENGSPISACEPAVISRRKVGLIMNTRWVPGKRGEPGKLKAEAWLETARLGAVDKRVAAAVQNRAVMEVSTGLFTDNIVQNGKWRNEMFTHVARNYRPDHLAILPDEKGACSVADGAGLMQNSAGDGCYITKTGMVLNQGDVMTKGQIVDALIANGDETGWTEADRKFLMAKSPDVISTFAANAGIVHKDNGQDEIDSDGDDQSDTIKDAKGQIAPKKIGSRSGATKNARGKRCAEDEEEAAEQMERNSTGRPVTNTVEDYIGNAPAGIREVLESGLLAVNSAKRDAIDTITANANNTFSEEYLETLPLAQLQGLAKLAGSPTANRGGRVPMFIGMGEVGSNPAAPTANRGANAVEPLAIPTLNFQRRAAAE